MAIDEADNERLLDDKFLNAACVYNYSDPKYHTIMLRVRDYAERKKQQLTWYYARGIPLFREERELEQDQLDAKRYGWLSRHDQEISHLTSLLPMVIGLPM